MLFRSIEEWQSSLPIVGGIVASQFYWRQYQTEIQDFQACGLPENTGFYEMRREVQQSYPDHSYFYEANTQTWRKGDWYGLRFLALYHGNSFKECVYNVEQKQLMVPYNDRWPQLYERALVLASGYLPQMSSDRLWLYYRNITPELVSRLTQKLTLTCKGL